MGAAGAAREPGRQRTTVRQARTTSVANGRHRAILGASREHPLSLDLARGSTQYLRSKNHLAGAPKSHELPGLAQDERTLRKVWELSELSANDFADEVAQFFEVPRVGLPELLAAPPLVKQFSRRFLREMTVFPYRSADGLVMLAVADPSDSAAVRAAALALGGDATIKIASFEDIATVLNERPGDENVSAAEGAETAG